mmetsp:Transcript_21014/g.46094  ORF Transcript_21014/g.46094 Transcript_21014/m.46094 type:complete len:781 (+) Transcript_21014:243-2585(+)|eukprot:CAMPEP_0202901256 /NCGR_PEP_ID=MMETSP1392-20130828/14149_1 /ASSEMBLY_ACC=CAM_ASM_000868 /TAXON_ID=225041 /ORGANISM="Chlamydomonas chlamydogama, Strain SAG 11-48b" /LENGTH=780 /DNA_ID=CAMNT_0049587795 /DNA_START=242 /DNA_END=2584 /DNA_ORIENTATION=+
MSGSEFNIAMDPNYLGGAADTDLQGQQGKVRLRLHWNGKFTKSSETAQWRYSGEVFNESIPTSFKYADLCRKLNEKFRDTVSFKYQSPGEDLDPENLVAVLDDDDLQELYDEYFQALGRPGTPLKTFRIKVYVDRALQFELDGADEVGMEASFCNDDSGLDGDINWESYTASALDEDVSASSHPSGDPSSDTELQWQQPQAGVTAVFPVAAPSSGNVRPDEKPSFHPVFRDAASNGLAAAVAEEMHGGDPADQLLRHGLYNFSRSIHLHSFVRADYIADDFDLDDPYHEPDEDVGFRMQHVPALVQRPQPVWDGAAAGNGVGPTANQQQDLQQQEPQQQQVNFMHTTGGTLQNKFLDRVRDSAVDLGPVNGNLPSHISVFGDSICVGGRADGSIKLPSHISAFGEGMDVSDAAGEHLRGALDTPTNQDGITPTSNCITQEFAQDESLVRQDGDDDVPHLEFHFQLGLGANGMPLDGYGVATTPKLLEAVVKVSKEDVKILCKIGEGAFGEVSQAQVFPYGKVAIKWLKRDRFAKYSESFQREAEVLAKLNHPNIIRMYGLVTESQSEAGPERAAQQVYGPPQPAIAGIMTEYVRGGSLSQQLRSLTRKLTLKERCNVALQASLGMAYLHDQNPAVIHFDLKPDNLLVEGEGDCLLVKVADFGLSKHKFQSYVSCRDLRGTLPYMAPELVSNPTQVCEKCDVWSMGVVMWELFTLEVPFQELSAQQILMGLMHGNLHLRVPSSCEPQWSQLVEACMEPNPNHRPTFKQLANQLEAILRQLQ